MYHSNVVKPKANVHGLLRSPLYHPIIGTPSRYGLKNVIVNILICILGFRDVGWDLLPFPPYNLLRRIHFHLAPEVTSDRQLSFFKFYKTKKTQNIIFTMRAESL